EIDNVRLRAIAPDGHVTLANARRALSNGDGSEVQLLGGAHVVREGLNGDEPVEFRGEFLHAFLTTERVRSHLPVVVTHGGAEVQAWVQSQGMDASRVAVYAADVRDIGGIVEAGRQCIAAQGLPDVVIANAGISIGVDTAVFEDLEVMRATYETNNLGMAA